MSETITTGKPPPLRRLLHISDLHFGAGFNEARWTDLTDEARKAAPGLVIVTGDLVNSPWRWTLRRALKHLRTIARDTHAPVWIVAGNHDTRISGVFSVAWLAAVALTGTLAAAAFAALAYGAEVAAHQWLAGTLGALAAVIAGAALVLRALVTRDLARSLTDRKYGIRFLKEADVLDSISVGIVPFDSATSRLSWARGYVTEANLTACKSSIDGIRADRKKAGKRDVLWIAAVHHHVLPLPYDGQHESMMVMDNAGALLRELARRGIRLILHGHKHHQHFARIAVDPATEQRLEVAVLSAGTATHGTGGGLFTHGFNVIDISPNDEVRIRMYEAAPNGGTFTEVRGFDLVPLADHARTQYEALCAQTGVVCRRLTFAMHIDPAGDARIVREFSGVETRLQHITEIPATFAAVASRGVVGGLRATTLSRHGPNVTAEEERIPPGDVGRMNVHVRFNGAGLQPSHGSVDLSVDHHVANGFALNRWQYESMYPDKPTYMEYVQFKIPEGVAVEEALVFVKFPHDMFPARFELVASDDGATGWSSHDDAKLIRLEHQGVVQTLVAHPRAGRSYRLNWDLAATVHDYEPAVDRAIRTSLALRRWLGSLPTETVPHAIGDALVELRPVLADELALRDDPLDLILYGYSATDQKLSQISSTLATDSATLGWSFPFGLGLPGKAFKSCAVFAYERPISLAEASSSEYIRGDRRLVTNVGEIPEASALAFPLAPPEAPDWPYAVLHVTTNKQDSLLPALLQAEIESASRSLNESLTVFFNDIIPR